MKFDFIDEHEGTHSVERMAEMMGVSRSGYYAWRIRPRSERSRVDEQLVEEIRSIQGTADYSYGSPRVTEELRGRGYRVGENRVARLLRENKLGVRRKRRYRSTTDSNHSLPVAENLLERCFDVPEANQAWVSDISYIATAEGWLYLCVVIDLYSRKVIGWSMSRSINAELVLDALMMALMRRKPPEGIIFHSDRGSQYCSLVFRQRAKTYGIRQSMSRKANPWDNAPAESFFKTLKGELCGHRAFRSREEARAAIFKYIEVFYNRIRLHSYLGYLAPEKYERISEQKVA